MNMSSTYYWVIKYDLMRSYSTTNNIDTEKENCNYCLSAARRSVECAFDISVQT